MSSNPDHVAKAQSYLASVLNAEVLACRWVKLACERAERDHARETDPAWPFRFDADKANRVCRFLEALPHIQGPLGGQKVVLEPWQCFIVTELFGWVWKETSTRRYRRASLWVPKGNGKTIICAGLALYLAFADKEPGADVVCTATSLEQAKLALNTAREQMIKNDKLAAKLGVKVRAYDIIKPDASKLRGLPAKGSSTEGVSLQGGIIDEIHAAKNRGVYDSLRTACSKRPQAMLFTISTAGEDTSGVGFEVYTYCQSLLSGEKEDEEFFCVIYGLDESDDWSTEESWRKANPNFGVSVDAKGIRAECHRAISLASMEPAFRTKHCNEWVSAFGGELPFLPLDKIRKCYDKDLKDDFTGTCTLGLDLASRLDLTTVVRVHGKRIDERLHYYVFCNAWLPAATLAKAKNASYPGWLRDGFLSETPGSTVDLEQIEEHVYGLLTRLPVREIDYDPLQSAYLVSRLQKRAPEMEQVFVEISQTAKYFTGGMLELEAAVADNRLHTNSPLLLWCLTNLRCKRASTNLLFPARPREIEQKIDAAVALVMALRSCAVLPLDESTASPYETGGILFV